MPKLRNLFAALLVLTLWLGSTQHCNLEAAGILSARGEHDSTCCPNTSEGCRSDGCTVVESAAYRSADAGDALVVPDTALSYWVDCFAPAITMPADNIAVAPKALTARLRPWVPAWHFDRRTVALPGAPA